MRWFASPRSLRRAGIAGMNWRNAALIAEQNPRRFYSRVDDKLLTKKLAQGAGIAVPELYAQVRTNHDASDMHQILDALDGFVIKPAHGSGGEGIVVVLGRSGTMFRKASSALIDHEGLTHHVSNILSGMYSLGGQPDTAMIEQRVVFDPLFERITHQGVPDIRTVVYRGVPILAMVRLPTRLSDGKANLHQGAVGAGVDMATGALTTGIWHNQPVDVHPDSHNAIAGLQIPSWERLLEIAARCYELTGLGYLGVDVVLDAHRGPLMLELNARPGLSIQLANRVGLRHRVAEVDRAAPVAAPAGARVAFAMQTFGGIVAPEVIRAASQAVDGPA
ncbi:MAG: alpha-L-glutamate ligase-like protein [Algiphilus sp.]